MNLRGSSANLAQAVKDLSLRWDETQKYWRDVKSQEFEKDFLQDLPNLAARAASVIEEVDNVLRKVKADCE
jgi:hypothetical protein